MRYPIRLSWDALATATGGGGGGGGGEEDKDAESAEDSNSIVVFRAGDATPFSRRVTFKRPGVRAAARRAPGLALLERTIRAALAQAKIEPGALHSVELMGGGIRPRAVKRRVANLFGLNTSLAQYGLSTTLNFDECVSRGCALSCAALSPLFRVKDFEVQGEPRPPPRPRARLIVASATRAQTS